MLWRLPAPVRSLLASTVLRSYSTARDAEPLRILFCGSDDFSIASLDALCHARDTLPGLIGDIHVAHRPAKPTGRGLKTMREVPISSHALTLSLPTHTLDTFTRWTPPIAYNLIIAVSFGLLVPPRILSSATHGGLNVHPSLLPDLRGSAPITHAILRRREYTGVSVQTLHPSRFDAGVVLAQSEAPGLRVGAHESARALEGRLADVGASMLVDVLKTHAFVPPLVDRGWYNAGLGPVEYAPKITKKDRCVDFAAMRMDHILAVQRALGDTWCLLPNGDRLVIHELVDLDGLVNPGQGDTENPPGGPGLWVHDQCREPLFRAACGRVGKIKSSTYAGGAAGKGNKTVMKMLGNDARL